MNTKEKVQLYNNAKHKLLNGEFNEAEKMLLNYLDKYPYGLGIHKIYGLLGKLYFDWEDFPKAIKYCDKALGAKPSFELASLGKYLSFVKMDKHEDAIDELNRFLSEYKAGLYIDTLKELLEDIRNGYATNFEKVVKHLAKLNKVKI